MTLDALAVFPYALVGVEVVKRVSKTQIFIEQLDGTPT
jgi:hypothetical protein